MPSTRFYKTERTPPSATRGYILIAHPNTTNLSDVDHSCLYVRNITIKKLITRFTIVNTKIYQFSGNL